MTAHPLRPATRHRLGRPSPHQQADRPRAHPPPQQSISQTGHATQMDYLVLATLSCGYPKEGGRLLTCYSPVRHSHPNTKSIQDPVRLACVKHAASVRPEPGSNSPNKKQKTMSRENPTNQNQQTNQKQSASQPKQSISKRQSQRPVKRPQPKKQKQNKKGQNKKTHYRVHKQHPHTDFPIYFLGSSEALVVQF